MGRWPANFLAVFRMALGDNDMGALYYMEPGNQIMFWFIWFLISLLFQIIFLNFIIAELSNTYSNVMANYDQTSLNQRCALISETEEMYPESLYNRKLYEPQYVVIRSIES